MKAGEAPVKLRLRVAEANDVIIRVYDRDGFKTLSELGPDLTGTVYVASDQNLVGVVDFLRSQQQLVSYNAFSQ